MTKHSTPDQEQPQDGTALPQVIETFPGRFGGAPFVVSTWLKKNEQSSAEGLVIDGNFHCAMAHHQQHLTVSENARVKGSVSSGMVVVFGQVVGNIYSDGTVWLAKSSDVQGNIYCARLFVEEGASFVGEVKMGECVAREKLEYC